MKLENIPFGYKNLVTVMAHVLKNLIALEKEGSGIFTIIAALGTAIVILFKLVYQTESTAVFEPLEKPVNESAKMMATACKTDSRLSVAGWKNQLPASDSKCKLTYTVISLPIFGTSFWCPATETGFGGLHGGLFF